ncbi:hypothetical protein RED65_01455 [Oceanobacter sp. RED65]|uniref:Uncharacterized protein n=1 Tax=Bermanella marisrubri TaxID=207949 RepID=Q1N4P3_9GAMM|nr:hypothetical protein RED65_01455 [Oceanobacter sp. RED65] [Bermanella marisrubri]
MEFEFFKLIAATGDVATAVIALAIWRLDRRVFALEIKANQP